MAKAYPPAARPPDRKATEKKSAWQSWTSPEAIRETIESVAIAIVLAFLFRTFEAEAFVIPTGSMAPTLMGRHKDIECPQCGYGYQANASDEVFASTGQWRGPAHAVAAATCPLCRFTADLDADNPQDKRYPSFLGDRIVVGKYAYEFKDPDRWDVIVFKYPGEAKTNYIKRVVGLPGETVRLSAGDVLVRPAGGGDFEIARKPPERLLAVAQTVYDSDFGPRLAAVGWPLRWQPDDGAWRYSEDGLWLSTEGKGPGPAWVRYRHLVPTYDQWQQVLRGRRPADDSLRPTLITDFTAYNTSRESGSVAANAAPDIDSLGLHWVGDLLLECNAEVRGATGVLWLELVRAGRAYRCAIDVATGRATLAIEGQTSPPPTAQTAVRGPGTYELRFSNFDRQLLLWVNGTLAAFDRPTDYPAAPSDRPQAADLAPAGVAAQALDCRIGRLRVKRDLYYIAMRPAQGHGHANILSDFAATPYRHATATDVARFLADPTAWDTFGHRREVDFPLEQDQFLVLGDNSARSKDSRLWELDRFEWYVRRELLIGRAVFIYWPHSWHKISIGGWDIPFPYFPNFARMELIR